MAPLIDDWSFLVPYLPADHHLWAAWFECLHMVLLEPDVVAAFRAEAGTQWMPAPAPSARLLDEATEAKKAFLVAFAQWMNAHIWCERHDT
jgi:hypothetical protein